MAMKLSTGKVAFPIEFDNGDKDCIYFNPSDPDLATRLIKSKDRIEKQINEMQFEDFELASNGEPITVKSIDELSALDEKEAESVFNNAKKMSDIMDKCKEIVCNEIDVAFGGDVSSVVFKHCSPFAQIGGKLFVTTFLESILPEIEKHAKKEQQKAQKRMGKHINKYIK